MNNRERKRREVEEHNRRHEKELEWRKVGPLFAYLVRLCETRQQAGMRRRQKGMMAATLAAYGATSLGGFYGDSDGNVTTYINAYSKV